MKKCYRTLLFLLAAALSAASAHAQTTANIDNGVAGVGHLDVNVDAFGAYGNFNTAYVDNFEPMTGGSSQPAFSAGFRLFSDTGKVLLSEMPEWLTVITDSTWSISIVSDVTNSDSATVSSIFEVLDETGLPVLNMSLTQKVSGPATGIGVLEQRYTITNISGGTLDFTMNRVLDADLVWDGSPFDDDSVSASDPLGFVSQHEPTNLNQALALRSGPAGVPADYYWGGKATHEPTMGPPAFGFGTDIVVWDANGLPETWRNYIAYAGYDTPGGDSGEVTAQDGHIGLEWVISLESGAETVLDVRTIYGAQAFCIAGDVNGDGTVSLLDVSPFVSLLTSGAYLCEADVNGDGAVSLLDVSPFVGVLTGG